MNKTLKLFNFLIVLIVLLQFFTSCSIGNQLVKVKAGNIQNEKYKIPVNSYNDTSFISESEIMAEGKNCFNSDDASLKLKDSLFEQASANKRNNLNQSLLTLLNPLHLNGQNSKALKSALGLNYSDHQLKISNKRLRIPYILEFLIEFIIECILYVVLPPDSEVYLILVAVILILIFWAINSDEYY